MLVNVRGYSRNLRTEITKKSKYYFLDNGIRNAVISNFNPMTHRNDVGQLWENFLMMERLKTQAYAPIFTNSYFWRTWDQQEVDLVEEREGRLFGFEFKYRRPQRWSPPSRFIDTYKNATVSLITPENYLEFLAPPLRQSP